MDLPILDSFNWFWLKTEGSWKGSSNLGRAQITSHIVMKVAMIAAFLFSVVFFGYTFKPVFTGSIDVKVLVGLAIAAGSSMALASLAKITRHFLKWVESKRFTQVPNNPTIN